MLGTKGLSVAAAAVGMVALAGQANDWENLAVNSINREPPRTYAMPLASEAAALTDAVDPETPYRMSLNGTWKISWAGNPDLRVKDFYRADFDDSDWFEIDVPSCVEMRGFGSPGYVNIRYPHKMEWPYIRDRQSGKADYNPVSSYRRTFTVPAGWKGREVFLRFDGVYSAYYVWVNGKKVGYAEDSKLPSEFNVTRFLRDGENLLAVEVYRWCDGSYLEDQDMCRFSGIFRDVTLWSMPKGGIWDFEVKTALKNDYRDAEIEVAGCDGAEWKLYDAEGRVAAVSPERPGKVEVKDVELWSAEKPYLYTLVVKKGGDIRSRKVGFKEIKVSGNTLLFNGRKIKFKGVNRHETSPDNGRTVTLGEMVRDIELMKRYNINTVRTCHYPDHRLWYDLCDRYGLYVCAEANVEAHEPGYGEKGLGLFPEWTHSIVERNVRQVLFYRNHPSVTLWSMGNETGHGPCFTNAIAQVKALDPSRPVHWEGGNVDADVDSRMYPSVEWLDERGRLGDKARGEGTMPDKYNRPCSVQSAGKPFWMCEYAHAMGNSMGNFKEYWDVFYKYDSLTGGCIWDWADQALWKYTDKVGADGRRERFLAYGGDWDEQPNDGPFNCNGVVGALREVSAKLVEVGHVHRNLVVDGDFNLENRFGFTYADEFDGEWELVEDGTPVQRKPFKVPHVAPLSKGRLVLPEFEAKEGKECFVNVYFKLKGDTLWARKGWTVASDQIAISPPVRASVGVKAVKPRITQDDKTVTAVAGGTKAVFCRRSGTLCELVMNGRTILKDPAPGVVAGPRLTCLRAFTDNDAWLRGRKPEEAGSFYLSGLSQLSYHARPARIEDDAVCFTVEVTGAKSAAFTHETEWRFGADGSVTVRNTVTPRGTMPAALPRLGLSFKLDKALEDMRYYGRGPRENYVDRKSAAFLGVYGSTVTEQSEDYVRPQDNGYKCDVRWAEFTAPDGKGVKFSASEPLFMQALHYEAEDLEFARHRNSQQRFRAPPVRRDEVCLNLDIRQLGLGGASCGPKPMDGYVFPVGQETWTVKMEPVGGEWSLEWSDEFDGPSVDPSVWTFEEGWKRNKELQYYTVNRGENACIEDGKLVITARKEKFPNRFYSPSAATNDFKKGRREASYTSASLSTKGKFDFLYGKYEVRAKIPPQTRGTWPAVWLCGLNQHWPKCGEIDVMESVGHRPGLVFATTHWTDPATGEHAQKGESFRGSPDDGFHIYGIEWDENRIDYFYDGVKYNSQDISGLADKDGFNPFRHPFYLRLNLAFGGGWGGRMGVDDTALPARYEIDYARLYKRVRPD